MRIKFLLVVGMLFFGLSSFGDIKISLESEEDLSAEILELLEEKVGLEVLDVAIEMVREGKPITFIFESKATPDVLGFAPGAEKHNPSGNVKKKTNIDRTTCIVSITEYKSGGGALSVDGKIVGGKIDGKMEVFKEYKIEMYCKDVPAFTLKFNRKHGL